MKNLRASKQKFTIYAPNKKIPYIGYFALKTFSWTYGDLLYSFFLDSSLQHLSS